MKLSLRSQTLKMASAIFILGALTACGSRAPKSQPTSNTVAVDLVSKKANEISVMTFNVENLFDTVHDKDREDFAYLPLAEKSSPEVQQFCAKETNTFYRDECLNLDWNKNVLQAKMKNLASVIRHVDAGKGPDNLFFVEVENILVLKQFVQEQLSDLGYKTVVLIEGPDMRGIDVGFISKFPLAGAAKLHNIPYQEPEARRSRGILEATVTLPNKKNLTFLVGHFPSQSNPVAWRTQAVQFGKKLMADYQAQGRAVILGGDLNISAEEERNEEFFKTQFSEVGQVSHLVGCQTCDGSHNYRGEWSFLDVLIYSKNLRDAAGVELMPESLQVVKAPVHTKSNGTPFRFDPKTKQGVSDHFPLYSRLRIL